MHEKGFGFIEWEGVDLFYHVSGVLHRDRNLEGTFHFCPLPSWYVSSLDGVSVSVVADAVYAEGDEVEFELAENPSNGRLCAMRVRVLHPISNPSAAHPVGGAPPLMQRAPPAAYQPRVYQGEVHSALPPRGYIVVNRAGPPAQNRVPFELKENMAQRPLIMRDKVVFQYVPCALSSSMHSCFCFFHPVCCVSLAHSHLHTPHNALIHSTN